jgi:hypothetical protein
VLHQLFCCALFFIANRAHDNLAGQRFGGLSQVHRNPPPEQTAPSPCAQGTTLARANRANLRSTQRCALCREPSRVEFLSKMSGRLRTIGSTFFRCSRSTAAPAFRTRADTLEHGRLCYATMLCDWRFRLLLRGKRMGGDSNPWCLAAHTLSRRAQSTALSPIHLNHTPALADAPNRNRSIEHDYEQAQELQLQPPEQFIERQLDSDKEFSEVRIVGADPIKTHFVDDSFNLKGVARKKRNAPLRVIKAG